jgi:hypothetical protein
VDIFSGRDVLKLVDNFCMISSVNSRSRDAILLWCDKWINDGYVLNISI